MTKITNQQIFNKVQSIGEYISYLDELSKETKNEKNKFLSDFHFFGAAERYLQLSIQVIMDIVQMIIIEEGLERPEDNQEAISLLFNKKIISESLASRLDGIVGFRNILVHEYGKIDKNLVYEYLQERVKDLKDFKKEILRYLAE